MDRAELVRRLAAALPADAVIHGADARATYALDGQPLHGAVPDVVVLPRTHDHVVAVMEVARDLRVPLVPRGAGTGLSGGAVATLGGVLLSTARMRRILELSPVERTARVEPGVVNADLGRAAAVHGLRFAPDPSSQAACTVGGNVAENAGGPHTLRLGVTTNHVTGVVLVTPDALTHRLGACADAPRPGDDSLLALVTGSEGLFGVVTEIAVRLVALPAAVRTLLASFPTVAHAARAVSAVVRGGVVPAALELMDRAAVRAVEGHVRAGLPTDAGAVLLVELEGADDEVDDDEATVLAILDAHGATDRRTARDERERALLWAGRKQVVGALGRVCKGYYTHDGVVPPSRLAEALTRIDSIVRRHGLDVATVAHAGDGNLHPLVLFRTLDADELARGARAGREILETCLELGGSLTGEHGVGCEMRDLFDAQFDAATRDLFDRVRTSFDPGRRMNPGKVLPDGAHCGETGLPHGTKRAAGWL